MRHEQNGSGELLRAWAKPRSIHARGQWRERAKENHVRKLPNGDTAVWSVERCYASVHNRFLSVKVPPEPSL